MQTTIRPSGTRPAPGHVGNGHAGNGHAGNGHAGNGVRRRAVPAHGRAPGGRPSPGRAWLRRLVCLIALPLVVVGWSYGHALTVPGGGSLGVRTVEWIRSHGGAGTVAGVENFWYSHHAPPKGGKPPAGYIPAIGAIPPRSPISPPGSQVPGTTPSVVPGTTAHLGQPPPITPLASPPLPGEGVWHPIGRQVNGSTAMYSAFLRPDAVHTSLVTGVAWMDPKLLSARLFAGSQEPGGGPWPYEAPISSSMSHSLVGAFNSGFRMKDAHGGYYAYGRTAVPLVNGAASLVIYDDGTTTVGQWGRDVAMGPDVAAVRQNLTLIVDHRQPVPGLDSGSFKQWGTTIGNKVLVWRSGVGVTANGALLYAAGNGLSASSLARVLAQAGAVRAMEMDINSEWTNFFSFNPAPGQPAAPANASKLLPDMRQHTSRYFQPSTRDFIVMTAR